MNRLYDYNATVIRVIDGDTLELEIDLGFHVVFNSHVRLYACDAAELNTPEGKLRASELLYLEGKPVLFVSHKDKPDKYGRLLGSVFYQGVDIVEKYDLEQGMKAE